MCSQPNCNSQPPLRIVNESLSMTNIRQQKSNLNWLFKFKSYNSSYVCPTKIIEYNEPYLEESDKLNWIEHSSCHSSEGLSSSSLPGVPDTLYKIQASESCTTIILLGLWVLYHSFYQTSINKK